MQTGWLAGTADFRVNPTHRYFAQGMPGSIRSSASWNATIYRYYLEKYRDVLEIVAALFRANRVLERKWGCMSLLNTKAWDYGSSGGGVGVATMMGRSTSWNRQFRHQESLVEGDEVRKIMLEVTPYQK